MRVAIYAMGSGSGHAVSAMGLARALRETDPDIHCLLLAPERVKAWARVARVPVASPVPMALRDADMLAAWVSSSLREFRPDVLVVDVFPQGILGELADRLPTLAPYRVLLTRWVNPRFYLRDDVARAVRDDYHAHLWTEPPSELLEPLLATCPHVERVPPVLFVRPQDVELSTAGRQAFGIAELERVVLGLGSGDAATERAQLDALLAAAHQGGMRFSVLFFARWLPATDSPGVRVANLFPAGAWLRACPVVVASAGYQSYYEVVQANVPAVFCPLPRPLDDQLRRARGGLGLVSIAPHAVVEDGQPLGPAIRPLLERELQRRYQLRGNLSDDVEMRGPASAGAAAAASALMRLSAPSR